MPSYDPAHDHLLLFDGICHLCDRTVRFVLRHDRDARLKFAPIQSDLGRRLYQQHGLDPKQPHTMLLITPVGAFHTSNAILEIGKLLGGMWSVTALFRIIPRGIRDSAYRFIASNRYRWFGKSDACLLPTPELRMRMLE